MVSVGFSISDSICIIPKVVEYSHERLLVFHGSFLKDLFREDLNHEEQYTNRLAPLPFLISKNEESLLRKKILYEG